MQPYSLAQGQASAASKEFGRVGLLATVLVAILAFAPLLSLFARGFQIFDLSHEFVAYRIGDGLAPSFGEGQFVHPVQGLPTALLSKVITLVLYAVFGSKIVSPEVLQFYSALFYLVLLSAAAGTIATFWSSMTISERASIAPLAASPWYLVPTTSLLLVPDYWLGEYSFLIVSLAVWPVVSRSAGGLRTCFVVGAWAGVGLAAKVSLIGVLPVLFLALPQRTWANAAYFVLGCVCAYCLLVLAYAGFRPGFAAKLLAFQLAFYIKPNVSQVYPSLRDALASNLPACALLAIAAVASIRARSVLGMATLVWLAVYIYLIAMRPHDTSLASAMLSSLFVGCLHLQRYGPSVSTSAIAGAIGIGLGGLPFWELRGVSRSESSEAAQFRAEILYLPDNYWNAATPLQAFAYNGGLLLRPQRIENGRPVSDSPTFRALFGPTVMLGASDFEIEAMVAGLRDGMSVSWTRKRGRPRTPADEALERALNAVGATTTEREMFYHGAWWTFATARGP